MMVADESHYAPLERLSLYRIKGFKPLSQRNLLAYLGLPACMVAGRPRAVAVAAAPAAAAGAAAGSAAASYRQWPARRVAATLAAPVEAELRGAAAAAELGAEGKAAAVEPWAPVVEHWEVERAVVVPAVAAAVAAAPPAGVAAAADEWAVEGMASALWVGR